MPEGTLERDRAAEAWYEATCRTRANRWSPYAFPDEDLKRLWDILGSFQLDAFGYRGRDGAKEERGVTMGFRFRKYVRLSKDAWMNLSKQGGYLSIGGHGLTTDVSKEGAQRETVSAPGPFLSGMKVPFRLQV